MGSNMMKKVILMVSSVYPLWNFECEHENPVITHYKPEEKTSDWSVVIFAGGAYEMRADHEGKGYAEFLNANGINAFVVDYRITPCYFPAPLMDARRAMRMVRDKAAEFGINPDKVAAMGSSAGGHLTATLSTYLEPLEGEEADELLSVPFLPNAQILCYPVIHVTEDFGHVLSGQNLLGDRYDALCETFSLEKQVKKNTPPAFIWHTFADDCVPVYNSLAYVKALKDNEVPTELHIFPEGHHGLGLADMEDTAMHRHVAQWGGLLLNWFNTLD